VPQHATVSVHAAQAEPATVPAGAPSNGEGRWQEPPFTAVRNSALWWPTLLFAGILCFVTFHAKGGLNLESMTTTEMALTIASGLAIAAAVLLVPAARPVYGRWAFALLLAFTILTALSIVWSVQPDDSWRDANRLLAYSAVFAAAIALVRLSPERWPAVLGGIVLAAVAVCGYALLTKVFPSALAAANAPARLEEPFGYWNATGLAAAMGAICCLWLGSRRSGHALMSTLAYPAMGLLLLTLSLAYSRGALVAFAIGVALWFCVVPLRLRGAAVLCFGALGAGAVSAWDFSRHSLSAEGVALADRTTAGHQLGALVLAMLLVLAAVGIAIGFATDRRAPSLRARHAAGTALLALIVLSVLVFAGALAHSQRGLTGTISHAVDSLTNPNAKTPPNTPGRLTAVASVRARYWKQAFQVFDAHPALGAGAEGYATAHLRYRNDTLTVRHAHGFVVQTLADLGIVGLLLALALLLAWLTAAGRATHPFNRCWARWGEWRRLGSGGRPGWLRRPQPYTPERIGLLSMLCVVVVFGAHSLIDWTWYVPGDACVALICAGWLAGRGPLGARATAGARLNGAAPTVALRRVDLRPAIAVAALIATLLAAWSQWQPQRSEEARAQALALLATNPLAANAAAESAVSRNPLSVEALFTLAEVQSSSHRPAAARETLEHAVRLQPSNPETWLRLGRYDLANDHTASGRQSALKELQAAIFLNPSSISPEAIAEGRREAIEIYNAYIEALRASTLASAAVKPPSTTSLARPGLKSARGLPAPAARAARQRALRRAERRAARKRSRESGR
jgi:O-Antigen ligase